MKIFNSFATFTEGPGAPCARDLAALALRLGFGLSIIFGHGIGKFQGYSQGSQFFPDPLHIGSQLSMALAIFAELFCGACVVLGLATRLALLPLITTMAVAVFMVHGQDPWYGTPSREMALIYGCAFCSLLVLGPGRIALDHFLLKALAR